MGESTHLPPVWPGFNSWNWCHMWIEFIVGSRPCTVRFFSWCFFPSSQKSTFPNSSSMWIIVKPLAWEIEQALPVFLTLNKLLYFTGPVQMNPIQKLDWVGVLFALNKRII